MAGQIRKSAKSDRSWLALAVLVLGLAATLCTWYVFRSHEREQIRWATKLAADAIRIDLTTDMEWQMFGLDRLALLWEAAQTPQPLWTKNADLYIQHRPGCVAVEWLAPDGNKRVVVRGRQTNVGVLAFDGVPRELIQAAAASKAARISAPVPVPDGSKQYAIAYPAYTRGKLRGFVVSFFDFERSLGYILDDVKPLGFSLEVSQRDQHDYLMEGSSREHEREWATTAEVPVPGGTWKIRVWPNPGVLDRIKSRLAEATLVIGSILSLLITVVVYLGISAGRKSAYIREINEQLKAEVRTRADAQEELRRAHSQLELRVHERTAELAAANVSLERESKEHQRAEESLRELTGRLFRLQDEERRRLARELHDGTTQNLIALAMDMASLRNGAVSADQQTELLNDSARLIQQSIRELRTTSHLLHPPLIDELGLPVTLRSYVDGFAARSGIHVEVAIDPQMERLDHDVELGVFRIVQESLTNVHRHSHSEAASILLGCGEGQVRLEISDEGTGIPPDVLIRTEGGTAGVGIAGMRERVRLLRGRFEISSGSRGTTIRIVLPVGKPMLSSEPLAVVA
jgi:signal transduction histidine kinase/sensor domain CHASE-containing protein